MMTDAINNIQKPQQEHYNNVFVKHLCNKRLTAANMYTHTGRKLRNYYNHLLEAHYKRRGMQKLLKRFV